MSPGKAASQAGHAYLGAFLASLRGPNTLSNGVIAQGDSVYKDQYADSLVGCLADHQALAGFRALQTSNTRFDDSYGGSSPSCATTFAEYASAYSMEEPGTKVCLQGSLEEIERARMTAELRGIPHFLVVDSGCSNFYNGEPTITAIGFGPAPRSVMKTVTGKLQLLK